MMLYTRFTSWVSIRNIAVEYSGRSKTVSVESNKNYAAAHTRSDQFLHETFSGPSFEFAITIQAAPHVDGILPMHLSRRKTLC